jgi:glycosyltransferase involved in cell wall biosynthesis
MINVSIIIPHYNSTKSLIKLLNSIPIKEDIEVIIVDDYSNKKELIEYNKIKNNYPKFIFKHNNGNKSAGAARNIGLNIAKGKWLLFADADDYFREELYNSIKNYLYSDYDIVYFLFNSVFNDTKNKCSRGNMILDLLNNYIKRKNYDNELKLKYKHIGPWCKLISKSLVEKNNILFDETLSGNDMMFSTKVAFFSKKIDVSNSIIYTLTKTFNSLTTAKDINLLKSKIKVHKSRIDFFDKNISKEDFLKIYKSSDWIYNKALKFDPNNTKDLLYIKKVLQEIKSKAKEILEK